MIGSAAAIPGLKERSDAVLLLPPDAVPVPEARLPGDRALGLGHLLEPLLRPPARAPAVQPLPGRAGVRRRAGLRWHLRQRAPPERLRADAVAQCDGGDAGAAHQAGEDRYPGQRPAAARPPAARSEEHTSE